MAEVAQSQGDKVGMAVSPGTVSSSLPSWERVGPQEGRSWINSLSSRSGQKHSAL